MASAPRTIRAAPRRRREFEGHSRHRCSAQASGATPFSLAGTGFSSLAWGRLRGRGPMQDRGARKSMYDKPARPLVQPRFHKGRRLPVTARNPGTRPAPARMRAKRPVRDRPPLGLNHTRRPDRPASADNSLQRGSCQAIPDEVRCLAAPHAKSWPGEWNPDGPRYLSTGIFLYCPDHACLRRHPPNPPRGDRQEGRHEG